MLPDTSLSARRERHRRSIVAMATTVTLEVIAKDDDADGAQVDLALQRALEWFELVEQTCSRFIETSELMRVCAHVGQPVAASTLLCQVLQVALAAAETSGGAFDPTLGGLLASKGFDQSYRSGSSVSYAAEQSSDVTYRDVAVNVSEQTITVARPLVLDLGAVAKGMAIDLAARELERFGDFVVEAGGDLYARGSNADGVPWTIGIRHPRNAGEIIETIHVSNAAVCTSGDYERRQRGSVGHHILDARTGESADGVVSVTVRADAAVAADVLATTAFALGLDAGLEFLEREGVGALVFTPSLDRFTTANW